MNATQVVTNQVAKQMMRTRRSSWRCSVMVMARSSVMATQNLLLGDFAFVRWLRSVFGLRGISELFFGFATRLFKLSQPATHGSTNIGEFARAPNDQNNGQHDERQQYVARTQHHLETSIA